MPKDDPNKNKLGGSADISASATTNDDDDVSTASAATTAGAKENKPKKVLRACDACHHRRVRCNHNNPCDNCIRLNINCTWIKASKGKQASGRRIELLRKGHNPAAGELAEPSASTASGVNRAHPGMAQQSGPLPPSASRVLNLPPPQSPRHLPPPTSAMSPPAMPHSAPSPSQMVASGSGLYSRDGTLASSRGSFSSYGRYDPASNAASGPGSSGGAGPQHPSPSSHWNSPSARSPGGGRYSAHPAYGSGGYAPPPTHPASSSSPHQHGSHSHHHHHHHQQQQQHGHHNNPQSVPSHHLSHTSPHQQSHQHNSSASLSGAMGASSGLGFGSTSDGFSQSIAGSFNQLAPDVAAGLRLPDFGTSLADSYLNAQEGGDRRRNVLLDMQMANGQQPHSGHAEGLDADYDYASSSGNGGGCGVGGGVGSRQTVLDVLGQSSHMLGPISTPGSVSYSDSEYPSSNEPHPLSDSVLIPSIALFFERLQSIMPVFTRSWIFGKIDRGEHRTDPQLGAMLIALSAFALTQPVEASDPVDSSARKRRVRRLLEESVKMRSSALFGSNPSLEGIMTSFFIFGTLFGLGEENAAWFRLREAVTLGYLLRIHETSSYEHLDRDEQERRLRAYLLLAITERAYAIQSGSSITFRGNPRKATDAIRRKFDASQLQDFPNLQSRLFDVVDEKFVDCWNRKCPGPGCDYLDAKRAVQLHRAIKESDEDEQMEAMSFYRDRCEGGTGQCQGVGNDAQHGGGFHNGSSGMGNGGGGVAPTGGWDKAKVQKADVEVTRQWLLNRLWMICRSHGLLTADAAEHPLRIDYAIDIARETLRVCNALSLRSMEAHGIGLTRKLNDIAQTLVIVCRDYPAIAMSVPFIGDPVNTDPNLFGPYLGPSPGGSGGGGPGDQHSPSGSSGFGGHDAQPPPPTLGVVPFDKAFSPSYAIEAILHKYLDLFNRFRGGDHPYLPELVEAVKELPKMAELSFDRFLRDMGLF
ncbi:hypothetical protein BCV70DRAFT_164252 [Testicularia cyperi]|uniref:Zn(2)-C6 fungal-type domain-containing protein n=1 Tax=Testicularia cyperi TaxID=1882483 RepID=A0A317XKM1_9BASI|nr:hypothetical protein BCV70DRAFT_164252 [Testicularia cyperi]